MDLPPIVSPADWQVARERLLVKEDESGPATWSRRTRPDRSCLGGAPGTHPGPENLEEHEGVRVDFGRAATRCLAVIHGSDVLRRHDRRSEERRVGEEG